MGDQRAQPGFELLLDELIGSGDQCRVLDQPQRPGQLQPGPLVRLDVHGREFVQRPGPYRREVRFTHQLSTWRPHM